MTNQSFNSLVKQKASDHEAPVPPGAWEAIVKEKKKRRYVLFWWSTGSALLLFAVGLGILYKVTGSNKVITAQQTAVIEKTATERKEKDSNEKDNKIKDSKEKSNVASRNVSEPAPPQSSIVFQGDAGRHTVSQHSKKMPAARKERSGQEYVSNDVTIIGTEDPLNTTTSEDSLQLINDLENILTDSTLLRDAGIIKPVDTANTIIQPVIKRKRKSQSEWSMDISVIPFVPVTQKQSLLSVNRTIIENMHKAEYNSKQVRTTLQPALAYNLSISKRISKHIEIGAGLQYAVIKEHITLTGNEINTFYEEVQRLDNSGATPVLKTDTVATVSSGTRVIDAINSYRLLEIPLLIQYMFVEKHSWSLRLNAGVQFGIATSYHNSIHGKLEPVYASGTHRESNTTMCIGIFSGVRFTNQLSKKYKVFAAPYVRFNSGNAANSILNNKPIHQAGMAIGINYKIGK
jgi:hypothetical protein